MFNRLMQAIAIVASKHEVAALLIGFVILWIIGAIFAMFPLLLPTILIVAFGYMVVSFVKRVIRAYNELTEEEEDM